MTAVFRRRLDVELPTAVRGRGATVWDLAGNSYLDAAGGAIVVGIGHGDERVADVVARQLSRLAYVHGTQFTTEPLEDYARTLAALLPLDDPRIYPVSGGSEAVETAVKLARSYHLARGEPSRTLVVARDRSYHGNTLGALDLSGRRSLRAPYEPWLGRTLHTSTPYEYRCAVDRHPDGCGLVHAMALDGVIREAGPENVACFVAEPISGAALGAAVPPDDYWPAVADVCAHHGVLLVADEVMTGFGRTGVWFASEHWGLRPDIVALGKGASSGYWPLGLAACSGRVFAAVEEAGFTNGFTFSHSPLGAVVGRMVLERIREDRLVDASRDAGATLAHLLSSLLTDHPHVGDVRGRGLLVGVELVARRETKEPFPRKDRVVEQVVDAAKAEGLLLYAGTGCADGVDGDILLLGPPLTVSDAELEEIAARLGRSLARVLSPNRD